MDRYHFLDEDLLNRDEEEYNLEEDGKKQVEVSMVNEARLVAKVVEIAKDKCSFTFDEALETLLDYIEQLEYELEITEEELFAHQPLGGWIR